MIPRPAPISLAVLAAACLTGCGLEERRNLAAGRRAYARLSVGMSCADACWFGGIDQPDPCVNWSFQRDYGRTFSRKEVILGAYIRDGRLVRIELVKPRYEGSVRKGDDGPMIEEQGVSRQEARGGGS
jgi:hypothetical protein